MQQCSFDNIPDSFIEKWQEIANLLANTVHVPAALIMKVENETMEVFTSSKTENNPYNIGDKENWHGLYCETVIKTQKKLNIPNALKDKNWDKNPDIKLGMIAYMGFPINFPDKTPFGTLCVLDREERQFTPEQEKILLQFKNTIELDLALICALELEKNSDQSDIIKNLLHNNEEYQVMNEEYLTTNEELQQANDELEQTALQAKRFGRIFENSLNEIYIFSSKNLQFIQVNEAAQKNLGYSQSELLQLTPIDLKPQFTKGQFKELISPLLKGSKEKLVFETVHQRKDKSTYHVEVNLELMDFEGENVFVAFINDISVRKKGEEALHESEINYHAIVEAFDGLIYVCSEDYRVEFMNERFIERTGYDGTGQLCYKALHNLDSICPWCVNEKVIKGEKVRWELQSPKDNRWYYVVNTPIYHADGSVSKHSMIMDITDRKQAEEKLNSNLTLLQIAGETARFGGWSVDLEKNTVTWSNAVADIHEVPHGYAPPVEEAINFYAPEWREKITQVFDDCAQKGISYDEEMEIITAKGKRIWVRANGKAIKDEIGKIIKVQGSLQDITERKQAEKALRDSEEMMRSSQAVAHVCSYSTNCLILK